MNLCAIQVAHGVRTMLTSVKGLSLKDGVLGYLPQRKKATHYGGSLSFRKYNNFEVLKFYGNNLEKIKEALEKKKDKEDYEENMKAFEKALKTPIEEMKKYLEENFHYQDDEIETYFHRIERKQYELDEEEDDDYMDNERIS